MTRSSAIRHPYAADGPRTETCCCALQAQHAAAVVNELSQEMMKVLEQHPINQQRRAEGKNAANVVLLRGCGSRINVDSFEKLHGMKACLIAPTKIIAGNTVQRVGDIAGYGIVCAV